MDFWKTVAALMVGSFLYEFVSYVIISLWKMHQENKSKAKEDKKIGFEERRNKQKRGTYSPTIDGRKTIGFKASFDEEKEDI